MSTHEPPAAGHTAGALKTGDLVELDYELWSDVPGGESELIDTTRESAATKANFKGEGRPFGPRPHQIGGEFFPAAIETALAAAKVGSEFTREFPPAEAFGERDPKLIELFSMHEISRLPEMRREDAELNLGTVLTIGGRRGRVVSMTAARVRVDFNPPLAGKKVRGSFKLLKTIHEPADQARALLDIFYGRGPDFQVELKAHVLTIQVPDRCKFDFAWMAAKPRVIERLRSHLKPHSIRIVEEYVTPTPKDAEKPATADPAKSAAELEKPAEPSHSGHSHAAKSPSA